MRTILVALVLMISTAASAQDIESLVELVRSDVKTEKRAIITTAMDFTEEESEAFWPVYREYEHELDKLADDRMAVIKDYAENYSSMTDEMAKDLAKRSFDHREHRLKLEKKYYEKFSETLSPAKAARWAQVENQILTLIDLQIASEIPLMEEPEMSEEEQ